MDAASSSRAPVLFVGHGAAVLTTDPRDATHRWMVSYAGAIDAWAPGFIVVSAHHLASPIRVTSSARPGLMHDHPASQVFAETYPAPGNPELARELVDHLTRAGLAALPDDSRPIDHGAWLPLRHFRPAADRFVVQVSLPGDDWHAAARLGEVLAAFRDRAVVLTSGGLIHDQQEFRRRYFAGGDPSAPAPETHRSFEAWALAAFGSADPVTRLLSARSHPSFRDAHPTPEHFVPLIVAAAAAEGDPATQIFSGVQHGLSTSAVTFTR